MHGVQEATTASYQPAGWFGKKKQKTNQPIQFFSVPFRKHFLHVFKKKKKGL